MIHTVDLGLLQLKTVGTPDKDPELEVSEIANLATNLHVSSPAAIGGAHSKVKLNVFKSMDYLLDNSRVIGSKVRGPRAAWGVAESGLAPMGRGCTKDSVQRLKAFCRICFTIAIVLFPFMCIIFTHTMYA